MDKYQVLKKFEPGALGLMLVVEEKKEDGYGGNKYVIKQVECIDEQQANDAFKEAITLLKLQHQNICSYQELFITWDNKISSLFLCLVMQHSGKGDLSELIEAKRQKKQKIEPQVVKKFLGQVMDTLVFLHRQNLLHRNLKPTNILVDEENNFLLGDFGFSTLMCDEAKWKIRVEEEPAHKSWMSPEALEFSFSEKSDIWSLGCILLEMATCSFLKKADAVKLLQDIRTDSGKLETPLTKMKRVHVADADALATLLPMMLRVAPDERISLRKLLKEPYVQEGLKAAGSSLSSYRQSLPPAIIDTLLGGGPANILELMQLFWDSQEAQGKAIKHLISLTENQKDLPYAVELIHLVTSAMVNHEDVLELQLDAARLLCNTVTGVLEGQLGAEALGEEDTITPLIKTMRAYPQNQELLTLLCHLLVMISTNEAAGEVLQKAGVLADIFKYVDQFPENREICLSCSNLVWSLLGNANLVGKPPREEAGEVITRVLTSHLQDGEVVESACSALWVLTLQGCLGDKEFEPVTLLLLQSLQLHHERTLLVKNVFLGLGCLVRLSELAALRVILTDDLSDGISLIKSTYEFYKDDPEVVETISLLLAEMAQYEEIVPEMESHKLDDLLREMKARFVSSEELIAHVTRALEGLEKVRFSHPPA
ncbi:serine/threonine kinase-like domain-containing protein STKLD1 [Tachyglossus aculeatus]|uniref:serine/threonine kinase-like domain-containing protein STKLD1 n=1 Tax=Tachyglossus aculeatus TaxID=9261 RepID=UPI0018F629C2|nr:serine/threonine kinase-like domain-containing protein STKLD1 [Tachyglossus aculeatus]